MPTYDPKKAEVYVAGFSPRPFRMRVEDIHADANVRTARNARLREIADLIFRRAVRIPDPFPRVDIPPRPFVGGPIDIDVTLTDEDLRSCRPDLDAAQCDTCGGWSVDVEDGRCMECRSLPGEVEEDGDGGSPGGVLRTRGG